MANSLNADPKKLDRIALGIIIGNYILYSRHASCFAHIGIS